MNIFYVLEDEEDYPDCTVWELKPLAFGSYSDLIALRVEGRNMEADILTVKNNLIGWSRFIDDQDRDLPFSSQNIDRIPPKAISELSDRIIQLSEVDDSIRAEIISLVRFSEFLSECKTPGIWDCDYCHKHNLWRERNCPEEPEELAGDDLAQFKKAEARAKKYGLRVPKTESSGKNLEYRGFMFKDCPVARKSWGAEFLYGLVIRSDNLQILPKKGGLLDQDNMFIQTMDLINSEKSIIERHKQAEESKKPPGKGSGSRRSSKSLRGGKKRALRK